MKKHSIIFSEILSYFRNWLNRKGTHHKSQTQVSLTPITTPEEILHLCCDLVRQKEMYVRTQAKRLNPYVIEKVTEPGTSLSRYKGLRIESEEYALWCEFFNQNGKPRKEKEYLYCQTVLLYFHDYTKLDGFLNVLRNEEYYQYFWDHCWLELGEELVKINLEIAKTSELPHCLMFRAWNNKSINNKREHL